MDFPVFSSRSSVGGATCQGNVAHAHFQRASTAPGGKARRPVALCQARRNPITGCVDRSSELIRSRQDRPNGSSGAILRVTVLNACQPPRQTLPSPSLIGLSPTSSWEGPSMVWSPTDSDEAPDLPGGLARGSIQFPGPPRYGQNMGKEGVAMLIFRWLRAKATGIADTTEALTRVVI
ncbi:hypothetical protein PDE_06564 [Penicillium oxalicum 114-2]|uniref:Uncharacterized protein n=1 Tax=Penicillium oxalicum (strain 114-2 / CGMCC 5302) TaxID=933388 RepID=S7ZMM4_PENO1|nr:hypothetical protein PDE_06564 [Penicillium oxalicum 114-2]